MNRNTLAFLAIAVTILYGLGFAAFEDVPSAYPTLGAGVVAIAWIAVGMLGRDPEDS